ncbi:hypothetical protein BLAT2472_30563 [Burkholderia latens]
MLVNARPVHTRTGLATPGASCGRPSSRPLRASNINRQKFSYNEIAFHKAVTFLYD